jgi:hypothetical protein
MTSRFTAHPSHPRRSIGFVLVGVAALLVGALAPALTASADDHLAGNGRAALFHIDAPAPDSLVSNGAMVAIGGWTAGTRVDAYLDGPAGVGLGIGSADVIGARPDVAGSFGAELAYSGFDVAWLPLNLSAGEHTLYLYAFIDGSVSVQTLRIIGEGNVLPAERDTGHEVEPAVDSTPSTDAGAPADL